MTKMLKAHGDSLLIEKVDQLKSKKECLDVNIKKMGSPQIPSPFV